MMAYGSDSIYIYIFFLFVENRVLRMVFDPTKEVGIGQ